MPPAATIAPPASPPGGAVTPTLVWVGILIVVVIVGSIIVMVVRRRVLAREAPASNDSTFMDELRAMRDRGEITPEEFEAAKRAAVRRLRGDVEGAKPGGPPSRSG